MPQCWSYAVRLRVLLDTLQKEYGYSEMDAFLVLKDILARIWNEKGKDGGETRCFPI